jgi:5'-nucleotidase (lipoprotein e(P4) family)
VSRFFSIAVLLVFTAAGCRSAGAPAPRAGASPAPSGPPMPAAIRWLRNSAEYRAAAIQAYRMATRRVDVVAASRPRGTWAVSLDADETVLDNSQYMKERAEKGLGFTSETWREWVARQAAPAVPGAQAFVRRVKEAGGAVVIVSNRSQAECPDTEENFRKLEIAFDAMLCRPDGGPGEKEARYESVLLGKAREGLPPLEIVLWVGDNIQDFPQQRQEMRNAGEGAFAQFGHMFVIIPNPMYGSWEKNPVE